MRTVANVSRVLYINYLARKTYANRLAPGLFRAIDIVDDDQATLFTILLFTLDRARPEWGPRVVGNLAPRFLQSNWRFYGQITEPGTEPKPGVFFVCTVTSSLLLAAFGRRLARCFPLHRARTLNLTREASRVMGVIAPGQGSAPQLLFRAEREASPQTPRFTSGMFRSYEEYCRWVVDQHLSLTVWPSEYVVQDMHLDFHGATIIPLRCLECKVTGIDEFVADPAEPIDCFAVEGLTVFLDQVYARKRGTDRSWLA